MKKENMSSINGMNKTQLKLNPSGKHGTQEMKAYIGLLLLCGAYPGYSLWSYELRSKKRNSRPVFRATMLHTRFHLLQKIVRFDDKAAREQRVFDDKLAPICELFDLFNKQCMEMYTLSEYVTIDKNLQKFRGRCDFWVCMPQKPGKYGLLFRVITDVKERYVSRMIPYAGKPRNEQAVARNTPTENVMDLTAHIRGSARNATMDRYYTSIDFIKRPVQ